MNPVLFIAAAMMTAAPQDAASADRQTLPRETWPQIYYLSAEHLDGDTQADCIAAARLMLASASRSPVLDGLFSTPVQGRPGLMRIDIAALGWDYTTWRDIVGRNPYGPSFPLVLRADWLLYELADGHRSDAYLRLLFGEPPKTRDEFLKRLGVIGAAEFRFGQIEGESGVSVQGTRWIENRPAARGYAWGTRDVLQVVDAADPLEHPRGDFKHDGEEWIVGVPVIHAATGQRGTRQVYFLANGKGEHVTRAPVDLVLDSTRFAGFSEIRAPGSCIQCHARGINEPTVNALRDALEAGVALDAQSFSELAPFHLSDLTTEIKRNQADFATGSQAITGLPPEEAAAAFKRAVDRYLAPVDLSKAAAELGVTPEHLKATLEQAGQSESIGARSASLARGRRIRRETFAELFLTMRLLLGELPAQKLAAQPIAETKPTTKQAAASQPARPRPNTERPRSVRTRQRGSQGRQRQYVPQRR